MGAAPAYAAPAVSADTPTPKAIAAPLANRLTFIVICCPPQSLPPISSYTWSGRLSTSQGFWVAGWPLLLLGPTRGSWPPGLIVGGGAGGPACDPFSGPPGPGWQSGHGGAGSRGRTLTSPDPHSADMPTPVAITAAPVTRLRSICSSLSCSIQCSPLSERDVENDGFGPFRPRALTWRIARTVSLAGYFLYASGTWAPRQMP